jgi:thiamine biosynthesis lipoprotein
MNQAREYSKTSASFRALGTNNEIVLVARDAAEARMYLDWALQEVARFEAKYSRYRLDSLVAQIRDDAGRRPTPIDEETATLLHLVDGLYHSSQGRFDCTSGVLRRAWHPDQTSLPSQELLERLRPLIGWGRVSWDDRELFLPIAGMEVDFGGIGKEYIVDSIAAYLRDHGFNCGYVNFGGDIAVLGARPSGDGWRIGVTDPFEPKSVWTTVELSRGAMATSGDYFRACTIGGVSYSHIMDVKTLQPVRGLRSVSCMADTCSTAGALTTCAMLLPSDHAKRFLRGAGAPHAWVDPDANRELHW